MAGHGPRRIVCLTEEPTETLYLLGEEARIVGISGFTVRPPRARREKPKVSAFTSARIERILDLRPDFVIGFSDIQAPIAAELIGKGIEVWIANHRSVEGILDYVLRLGGLVGRPGRARRLVDAWRRALDACAARAAARGVRPRVYFEEWDEPRISGIQWVSELVRVAGGEDLFPELAGQPLARGRILADDRALLERDPEIVIGSWCGKKFRPERVAARPGWDRVRAVRDGELHEVPSPLILQPGPAALTDGLAALERIIAGWAERRHRRDGGQREL
ncbi:MAG: cobalamin-binding protein [Lysobacteraceae bacterium]|nr:MAG: cobalamin-binding protein [Xanthomonadaceae bacterium]